MKKYLIFILTLILLGCSSMNIKKTLPIKITEKTVYLSDFPDDWEIDLDEMLSQNGWEVYSILNNIEYTQGDYRVKGQNRATFLIQCSNIELDLFLWIGTIKIIDLRTGKRVSTYLFQDVTKETVLEAIQKIINTIKIIK